MTKGGRHALICFVLTTEEDPIEADCLVVKTKNLCHKEYAENSSLPLSKKACAYTTCHALESLYARGLFQIGRSVGRYGIYVCTSIRNAH